jgi:transcription initiation factor IIE alpha subunit
LKKPQIYATLIRRIVGKLMFKCGIKEVKSAITDKSHLALVAHIDREKRKKRTAGEKKRLISEMKKDVGADKETQSLFADIGAEMG